MQVWTSIHWQRERPANQKSHKDGAELRTNEEPIPSSSDYRPSCFAERRNTEPPEALEKKRAKEPTTPGLRHCHTRTLPVQTKMSHAMTEVCNTLCMHGLSPTVHFHFRPQKTHQIVHCGTRINSVPIDTFSIWRRQQLSTESRFTNSSSSASHTDHLLTRSQ